MFGKIVALVQGSGTTSSDTLAFPACFGSHTMAWGVEMSACLEVCFSPMYDEELQLATAQSPPSHPCRGPSVDKGKHWQHFVGKATMECKLLLKTPWWPTQPALGRHISSTDALLHLRLLPNVSPRALHLLNAFD